VDVGISLGIMSRCDTLNLFDLPREILHFILRFVDLKDIGKFDSAITNHYLRPFYLSLVSGMTIAEYRSPFQESDSIEDYLSLDWLLVRKVIPCEIHLGSFHPLMLVLFFNSKSHLKLLSLNAVIPDVYFREIGLCPSLLDVSIDPYYISPKPIDQLFRSNPQLQKVKMQNDYLPQILTSLLEHCPKVTHLDLSDNGDLMTDDLVRVLVQSNLNLIFLDLDFSGLSEDGSIRSILDSFPNLRYLSFLETEISQEMDLLTLKRVVVPSLSNPDPAIQLLGLKNLDSIEVIHF
jgi:hypothetical protein